MDRGGEDGEGRQAEESCLILPSYTSQFLVLFRFRSYMPVLLFSPSLAGPVVRVPAGRRAGACTL